MTINNFRQPIVWTIAGSDSSGGAGIQTDLQTFRSFGVYGCSIITAITAQNSIEIKNIHYTRPEMIAHQIEVLVIDFSPVCIKLGMIGNDEILREIIRFFKLYKGYIVYDPVFLSSSGFQLQSSLSFNLLIKELLPTINILTPNIIEAEILSGIKITSVFDIEKAATKLLSYGVSSVLIKGGHFENKAFSQDYWSNGIESFWITSHRIHHVNTHGSGCTLSSAIASTYALGHDEKNACILAKHYINQSISLAKQYGKGPGSVFHQSLSYTSKHFPWVSKTAEKGCHLFSFPKINYSIGLYPIINNLNWLKILYEENVKTIQLRIKEKMASEPIIAEAVAFSRSKGLKLYINDYWELAIKYKAYGIHLGQEDLMNADICAIQKANLYLGISTHDYFELAIALTYQPSYIAFGPIYPTTSKKMQFPAQGLEKLAIWRKLVEKPLIAIGGINLKNVIPILSCKVDGIALISAIIKSNKPKKDIENFLNEINISRI